MEKAMCYGALGVAGVMALLFLVDIVTGMATGHGFPFGGGPFCAFDILGLIAAAITGYLGFNALKDVK
jgi:hypothetical protein